MHADLRSHSSLRCLLITGALRRVVTLVIIVIVTATVIVVVIVISAILIRVEFCTICDIIDVFEIPVWYFILDFIILYN
jgi:hypothetical protein